MSISTQNYKGTRDFYPEDQRIQDYIFDKMRQIAEAYGYQEYDAPLIEPLELYLAKTGEEIINDEIYNFTDRGNRQVAIRPEMTPSVSRMVAAKRQELAYPLRWFSIPNLWRYERPQKGRLREHWQLNVDIFGEADVSAEYELILFAARLMKSFGASSEMYEIRLNHRGLVNVLLKDVVGIIDDQIQPVTKLIDKKNKISSDQFNNSLLEIVGADRAKEIVHIFSVKNLNDLPEEAKNNSSVEDLIRLETLLQNSHVNNFKFDVSLMRGFDYYSGIVFEIFDKNPENNRSMFGGGRYDGLVGLFGVDPLPTVGFGMGDVTLVEFLKSHHLLPALKISTDVHVISVESGLESEVLKLCEELRDMELKVSSDVGGRKIDKKIKTAAKLGVRYVIFVGKEELASEQFPLKDLETGKEEKHSPERLVSVIKDYRKNS